MVRKGDSVVGKSECRQNKMITEYSSQYRRGSELRGLFAF